KAEIIIGGGDTADFLEGKFPKNVFISTGGGAMLEFLIKRTLPGIEAIKQFCFYESGD
ncbi:phosphoglycerate kinase, partial [Candidatus Giovannonibacteria bacterium]|nr:phosphoglycerate kinase [Candidatus Giovannonibacteria bacterium]